MLGLDQKAPKIAPFLQIWECCITVSSCFFCLSSTVTTSGMFCGSFPSKFSWQGCLGLAGCTQWPKGSNWSYVSCSMLGCSSESPVTKSHIWFLLALAGYTTSIQVQVVWCKHQTRGKAMKISGYNAALPSVTQQHSSRCSRYSQATERGCILLGCVRYFIRFL